MSSRSPATEAARNRCDTVSSNMIGVVPVMERLKDRTSFKSALSARAYA